jgi:hypothetical protein
MMVYHATIRLTLAKLSARRLRRAHPHLTPRCPPPRKSQKTLVLLEAVLAHFVAGKDVSQWLLPKGPIPRPMRR